ncbi:MAG: flagellar basal body L-ring protein FlgH [Thermodesulfobacteriota bacterium]
MSLQKFPGLGLILSLALIIGACVSPSHTQNKGVVMEPPKALPLPHAPPPQEGSLWAPRSPRGLLADLKACNVGDIVTVSIMESSQASDQATTQADRSSGVKVGVASLLGLRLPTFKQFNDATVAAENAIEGTVGNTSKGTGKTDRQSSFTTYITTRVIQILPNNNLVIQGERHMRVNNETEIVTLTGVIRPEDLASDNTIASYKVAEPRIMISGLGVVSDKQRQGWLTRIIDHIWPW